MTVSLRLSQEEAALFKTYAELNNTTLSEVLRNALMEKIEDEYDLRCYEAAIQNYKNNPVTYSHEEVAKLLDLD